MVFTIYEMASNVRNCYPESRQDKNSCKIAEKLARTRAKSGGNRSVMTKLSNEASELLQVEPINKQRLKFIAS